MNIEWNFLPDPELSENQLLSSTLKVDEVVSSILIKRGIKEYSTAEMFFRPNLQLLHDPFEMKNMIQATELIREAIRKNEKILLYGDYDVDGTCSVAMMYTFLKGKIDHLFKYVPDRYEEGYGVSEKGIDFAIQNEIDLFITLDCGIKNPKELNRATSAGIQVMVCDHHEPGENIPEGCILNPKQKDCTYPNKELCGCGVAFKLLQGLAIHDEQWKEEVFTLLDFVAVATGADIVNVMGENRILCYEGLKMLNTFGRPSFDALIDIAGKTKPLNLTDVVFTIAPRINAAGRINKALRSVELMISKNAKEIAEIAEQINKYNTQRRSLDEQTTGEALEMIEADTLFHAKNTTVVAKEGWSKGVVGIVASRLIEKYYRPTIVLSEEEGILTGSARTIDQFDIHDALVQCEDLFLKFGGHTHAAGLSMEKKNLQEFKDRFDRIVTQKNGSSEKTLILDIDQEIGFNDIYKKGENLAKPPRLKRILDQMEPHGPGNMKPLFVARNVYSTQAMVLKEKHLKMTVCQADSPFSFPAIAFSMAEKYDLVSSGVAFDMAFTFEENFWNNKTTLQLMVKDIKPSKL